MVNDVEDEEERQGGGDRSCGTGTDRRFFSDERVDVFCCEGVGILNKVGAAVFVSFLLAASIEMFFIHNIFFGAISLILFFFNQGQLSRKQQPNLCI